MSTTKELRIATGVLRRSLKELSMYRTEVEEGAAKLSALASDHNDYKQTAQVLGESRTMVSNTADRIDVAVKELQRCLSVSLYSDSEDDVTEAKALIDKAQQQSRNSAS